MKIDAPLAFPESGGLDRVGATGTSGPQNQPERAGISPDEVQLSVGGDKTQQLRADLSGVPDVRQERVAALQQAISQGSYKVSGEQIARAMSSDILGDGK